MAQKPVLEELSRKSRQNRWIREGVHRYSVARFPGVLVLLLVTLPFVEELRYGDLVATLLMTAVLLSAVLAVGGHRATLVEAAVLVTPILAGYWLDHFRPHTISKDLLFAGAALFATFVIWHLLNFIFRASG